MHEVTRGGYLAVLNGTRMLWLAAAFAALIVWLAADRMAATPVTASQAPTDIDSTSPAQDTRGDVVSAGDSATRAAADARRLEQPQTEDIFVVEGRVLLDRRRTGDDLTVQAYPGTAADRLGILAGLAATGSNAGRIRPTGMVRCEGEPMASTRIDSDGHFVLRTPQPYLRICIDDDFYALAAPEVVHVPSSRRKTTVLLTPYLGALVSGRLLGAGHEDIRDVRLQVLPDLFALISRPGDALGIMQRDEGWRTTPDAFARFRFRAVMPGAPVRLFANTDESAGETMLPQLEPGEQSDAVLTMRPACRLMVRVRANDGHPVEAASVLVHRQTQGDLTGRSSRSSVRTDAAGLASIQGLLPGTYQVAVRKRGLRPAGTQIVLPATQPAELQMVRGQVVAGIVLDPDGMPVEAAVVDIVEAMDTPMLGDLSLQMGDDILEQAAKGGVATDASGHFELTGTPEDTAFHVVASHPDHAGGIAQEVAPGTRDLVIRLHHPATVGGRVLDGATGHPITRFQLKLSTSMFLIMERPVVHNVNEDDDGRFTLTGVRAGSYELTILAEGHGPERVDVVLEAGQSLDLGEIRMHAEAKISGRVVDQDGRPIEAASVQRAQGGLRGNPVLQLFLGNSNRARTDAEGRFQLEGLHPGTLRLSAAADGFATVTCDRLELTAGQHLRDLVLTLDHGGTIQGRVLVDSSSDADRFAILAQELTTQRTYQTTPGPDGTFRLQNVDPGRYQIQAMHPQALQAMQPDPGKLAAGGRVDVAALISAISEHSVSHRCMVRSGQTTDVILDATDLQSGLQLTLEIRLGGDPLASGILEATDQHGRVRTAVVTHGIAQIGALQPGPLRVQVRSGITLSPVGNATEVEIPAGTDRHRTQIKLPTGSIHGDVVDASSGAPLAGIAVHLRSDRRDADDLLGVCLTDTSGRFAFHGLAAGSFGLSTSELFGQGRNAASRIDGITLQDGVALEGLRLRTQPAGSLDVRVLSPEGLPVVGAVVVAMDESGLPLGQSALAFTDRDGMARLGGLAEGQIHVAARGEQFSPAVSPQITSVAGQAHEVLLQLDRGPDVTLQVVATDGSPLVGATVCARTSGSGWIPHLLLQQRTGDRGTYDLGRLRPGRWEFRIQHQVTGAFTIQRDIRPGRTARVVAAPN
jgi:protocatechuate 3,4-dioxygenase beta subunit